tara:strand:- start:1034 stop:2398 length:1365 start_codon:yes stop_codon:yes gene_type:complete
MQLKKECEFMGDTKKPEARPQIHPFTDLHLTSDSSPLVIEKGEGIYLFDSSGAKYLDAMSSLWCTTLGYSQQRLTEAAHRQLSILPFSHAFRGRSTPSLNQLAQKLIDLSPAQLTNVFFACSGSEANESAVKIAWSFHRSNEEASRKKIIAHQKSYHGSAIYSAQMSGSPMMHEHQNAEIPDIIFVTEPDVHRHKLQKETTEDFVERLATNLENLILREGPETIAAFIAEPVMGVGGVIIPPKNYFEKVQKILSKYGVLLIADEVICGFGRTGNMFGSETLGMFPDIMTVAKGLSSAYFPISAVFTNKKINESLIDLSHKIGLFSHGFTNSGHPVGAAVALEAIKIIEEDGIINHVRDVSQDFRAQLFNISDDPIIADVRSIGLMGAFDLNVSEKDSGNELMHCAQKHSLFIRAIGNTIVLAPPLIISKQEINLLFQRLSDAIKDWKNRINRLS